MRKNDKALIGRCGLMELVVESAEPASGIRRGWFQVTGVPGDVELTFECELGLLKLPYAISAILPHNARSRRVAERGGARLAGQMDVVGLTWDRWVWLLAPGRTPT